MQGRDEKPRIASDYADLGEGAPILWLPSPLGELRYTSGHGLKLGRTHIAIAGGAGPKREQTR